jgi:hypothetical protein
MNKYLVTVLFALLNFSVLVAQDYRISLAPEFSIPLGSMNWGYKPGMGAEITFSIVKEKRNVLYANTYSLSYTSFSPRADTLYYSFKDLNSNTSIAAKVALSKLQMAELEVGLGYAISFTKKLAVDLNVGIGILYGKRTVHIQDDLGTIDESVLALGVSFSPTVGLEYIATQSISITPYVSYAATLIQLSDPSKGSEYYNSSSEVIMQYLTPGISLSYSF